jgi:predicted kinase
VNYPEYDWSELKRGRLFFMVGLPRSGKSTIAKGWRSSGTKMFPRVVVNKDNIRLAIHGKRWDAEFEPQVHLTGYHMVKSLLIGGYDVMLDETNCQLHYLKDLIALDNNAKYILVNTPSYVCKQRAVVDGQEDLHPIIDGLTPHLQGLLADGFTKMDDGYYNITSIENLKTLARAGK